MWHIISYFFGGAFLANGVPHFVHGISGQTFQTPFADPPTQGHSSSKVNIIWAFCNFIVGYLLIWHVGIFDFGLFSHAIAVGLGVAFTGFLLAWAFGRYNGGNV
jgi:hypothetical protein